MNSFHSMLKFKANYHFVTRKVEFLDTVISISEDGFLQTTLFTKPGKKCNYLLPSSCHPSHVTKNIPYSLALRLKRICSLNTDFLHQLDILKTKLVSRGYNLNYICKAFESVKTIERKDALRKSVAPISDKIVLSITFDPRLPDISLILKNFWRVMTFNPRMKRIFPSPPMLCWKRTKNLREFLIRAKLPKEISLRRSCRKKTGFTHCNRNCNMCKFSPNFASNVISSRTNESFPILSNMNCTSKNVIYCITCTKSSGGCKSRPQYIGETGRKVADRFNEHFSSIKPNSLKSIGQHFSTNAHSSADLSIVAIEQIRSSDPWIRVVREKFYIKRFDAILNKRT